jgi:Domain of unknown function (DUF4124)
VDNGTRMAHRGNFIASLAACCAATLSIAVSFGADTSSSGASKVYRWVDEKGEVHYGDSIPSKYAQSERSELNSQGVEVGHVEGGKNSTQLAEQARAAAVTEQRAQHDQFLLATYLSAKDIEQLRDERLALMEGQIKAALVYIDTLGSHLDALQERAMHFKPYSNQPTARRMPDDLAEDLVRTMSESRTQHQALDAKRREQSDTQAQFDSDIQRYRELSAHMRNN